VPQERGLVDVSQGPTLGEYDGATLLAATERILDVQVSGLVVGKDSWSAYLVGYESASAEFGDEHTHLASLLLHWLTGGRNDEHTLEAARAVLRHLSDPRRGAYVGMIDRISTGTISWDALARETKKGLIRNEGHMPPPDPGAAAVPLRRARTTLQAMLQDAASHGKPDVGGVWRAFFDFASIPLRAPRGFAIASDMSLSEWLAPDRPDDTHRWSLARQLSIDDVEGSYEKMVHVRVTAWVRVADEHASTEPFPTLWSEGDLSAWKKEIERTELFSVLESTTAERVKVEQETV
jgi:hypothetical protein